MAEWLLQDSLYLCTSTNSNGVLCNVKLTPSVLIIEPQENARESVVHSINIGDISGCLYMRRNSGNRNEHAQVRDNMDDIDAYLTIYIYRLSKCFNGNVYRKRETALLRARRFNTYEENHHLMLRWHFAIMSLARGKSLGHDFQVVPLEMPKLLIFVNPKSGTGTAVKTFQSRIRSFLGEADISYELVVTNAPGHCEKYIKELQNLDNYCGIVAVSGDGLVYEIYNGMFARDDWENAAKIPVGIIAQGSGNGLARSLAHFNEEPYLYDPLTVSILNVVKLKPVPMDLCMVETMKNARLCSFLSIGWGLIADIDIESERLRLIGEARFTVWALARILCLRKYKATISYLPANLTDSRVQDGEALPPLREPLQSDKWVVLKGEFICLYSSIEPFIGTDICFAPESKLNDGVIWLLIVKASASKLQIAQLLMGMNNGSHVHYNWLHFVPVTAFRLEPDAESSRNSNLTIDGEKLDLQPLQVEVLPGKGRVFMR